jgi:hypothetical protein
MRVLLNFLDENSKVEDPIPFDWSYGCLPRVGELVSQEVFNQPIDEKVFWYVSNVKWKRNGADLIPLISLSSSY